MLYFNRKDFCVFSFIFVFLLRCLRSAFRRFFLFHMENNVQLDGLKKSDIIGYDKVLESLLYPYGISLARGSQNERNSFDIRTKKGIFLMRTSNSSTSQVWWESRRRWVPSECSTSSFSSLILCNNTLCKKGGLIRYIFSLTKNFHQLIRIPPGDDFMSSSFLCQRQYTLACVATNTGKRVTCCAPTLKKHNPSLSDKNTKSFSSAFLSATLKKWSFRCAKQEIFLDITFLI